VVFGAATLFAVIAIVLAGLITNYTDTFLGGFFSFAALAIATGLLTLLTLPTMLIISRIRKGAFTSMIAVEIGWIWFLWIMWLAVGASTASTGILFIDRCGDYARFGSLVEAACNETSALTAFGFLSWIFLMFYHITLVTLTFRQHLRGYTGVWTSDVTETDFDATGVNNTQVIYDSKASPTYPMQYPPVGSPGIQQPTTGSYMQPVASPYSQSQDAASTFTHSSPQAHHGPPNPYPQF